MKEVSIKSVISKRETSLNQTPERIARDNIDWMLKQAGWKVQDKKKFNFNAVLRIAAQEYPTGIGLVDYTQSQLNWVASYQQLYFVYQSMETLTRFADIRDPKPRSREIFSFYKPETMFEFLDHGMNLCEDMETIINELKEELAA